MYGDSEKDPVVKYYDETLGVSGNSEIEWYSRKVSDFGGPILDTACGTGRLSIHFAQLGYKVVSIDNSFGMLQLFSEKLDKEPLLKRNISLYNMPIDNFQLEEKFNTILCVDAFFHNITLEQEKNCLNCVKNHLSPNGRFFFNVHNFNPNFIEQCKVSRGKIWKLRKKYWIRDNSEQIIVEQALDIDESKKNIITLLRFKRYNKKGDLLSLENSKWYSHYRTYDHYEKIISECGLELENVVGSYENGPINENSQLIFQIRRKIE